MSFEDWTEYFLSILYNKFGDIIYDNCISCNKNISLEYIIKNPDKKWNYSHMSFNPNITLEYVLKNPYKDWMPEALAYIFTFNPEEYFINNIKNNKYYIDLELNFSIEEIEYYKNKYNYNITKKYMLSCNPNISWNYIIENLDKKWNFSSISKYNKYITPEIIINYPEYFDEICISNLSLNKYIKWSDIEKYPDIKWNYRYLSFNPNITIETVINNLDKQWDFEYLSKNKNITMEIMKKYNNMKWNKNMYIYNPNFRLKDLDEYDNFDNTMIKYICMNNYDEDRKEFMKKNNIISNKKIDMDMLEFVCL